jgi:hypothetical protein
MPGDTERNNAITDNWKVAQRYDYAMRRILLLEVS